MIASNKDQYLTGRLTDEPDIGLKSRMMGKGGGGEGLEYQKNYSKSYS